MQDSLFCKSRFLLTVFYLLACLVCIAPHNAFSQEDVSQYKAILSGSANDSVKTSAYYRLSRHYEFINKDSAIYYLNEGMAYCTAKKYRTGIAWMYLLNATFDETEGRLDIATARLNEALTIFEENKNSYGMANVYKSLGVTYGKKEDYANAQKYVLLALEKAKELNNNELIGSAYLKLGVINEKKNNLPKALEDYNKALLLSEKENAQKEKCTILNNIGIVYGKMGDMKTAFSYFTQALEISKHSTRDITISIYALTNLSIANNELGNRPEALRNLEEAMKIVDKHKLPAEIARIFLLMGALYEEDQPEKALNYLNQAYEEAKANGLTGLRREVSAAIYESQKKMGNYKEALAALELTEFIKDSLNSSNSEIEIANLETLHELKESQAKVEKLKLEDKAQSLNNKIIIVFAIFLLLIIALMLLHQRKLKKVNTLLSAREKELDTNNRNKDKLFSIIGHDLRGPISNANGLTNFITEGMSDDDPNREMLDMLKNQLNAAHEILEKLLMWGVAQVKGIKIAQSSFQSFPVITNNISLLNNAMLAKNITLTNNIDPNLSVHGDANHFEFIFRNLLSNAIKFTYNGGSIILAAEVNNNNHTVVFSVKDSGVGIDPSQIASIFNPGNQSKLGTANEAGTSLGLMICREFAIGNGGAIWVESEKGKGSTFYFSFKQG